MFGLETLSLLYWFIGVLVFVVIVVVIRKHYFTTIQPNFWRTYRMWRIFKYFYKHNPFLPDDCDRPWPQWLRERYPRYLEYHADELDNALRQATLSTVKFLYRWLWLKKQFPRTGKLFRWIFRIKDHELKIKSGTFDFDIDKVKGWAYRCRTYRWNSYWGVRNTIEKMWKWALPTAFLCMVAYWSSVIRVLSWNKVIFVWLVVGMIAYWLLSGFVFFIKKYQFGKFTSAIQRFWRRSYILFWLIEFSLFSVFIYLTLNANNESWYMFDQLQVFKTNLFSWRLFIFKLFPLVLLLVFGYMLLLIVKWNVAQKHMLWLLSMTLLLIYVVWCEFYQFFHVVNFYGNFNWIFDVDEKVWSLELESRKSRTINHYIMLMIMLKFWHIIFIFIIWVFFILRVLEIGRIRYPLLSANLQNFLILYLFAWVSMFPWFKFIFRRYLDTPYYWFYINNRKLGYRVFFNDISIYYYGLIDCINYSFLKFSNFFNISFFYWSQESDYFAFKKSFIKDAILKSLLK